MTENLTLTVAQYAASTSSAQLPADVKERAKQVISDEIACAFFGRRSFAGSFAARYAAQSGGAADARIHATGRHVSAPNAALANGAAGHGEAIDGAHAIGGHPGASIVHAAVAMAERQRSTGAELLNAVVLGYDVGVRIVAACGGFYSVRNRLKLHSDYLFALACASASGRLLGLDPLRHCHAMALSSFSTNALPAMFSEKHNSSKALCNGQFASAGVNGALMAAAGLEGNADILGAPFGVLDAWGLKDRRDALTHSLGERYEIMGHHVKFLNCAYQTHSAVEAALNLVTQHRIGIDAIELIYVGLPTETMKMVDNRDNHDMCQQDLVAAALLRGGLDLKQSPFPGILAEPAFPRLRARVALRGDPDLDRDQPSGRGAIVRITTVEGTSVTQRIEYPRGNSHRGGVTWDELAQKWRSALPECDVDRMLAAAQGMEDLEDVRELVDAFTTVRH